MAEPVWQTKGKGNAAEELVRFCAGRDVSSLPPADLSLLPMDIWTNRAHAQVLHRAGVLRADELQSILRALKALETAAEKGEWQLDPACEDIHMAVESFVTEKTGTEIGGKLHTGRSRNDQIATDMRLWLREALLGLCYEILKLFSVLNQHGIDHADAVMPGFTHQRPAMVTSWGSLVLGHASALERDVRRLLDVISHIDVCPLGAAAGYGTSWPLDRRFAAELLGFDHVLEHPTDAVGNRWEPDAEASVNITLYLRHMATLAQDLIAFSSPNFGFIGLPKELTTGSSIMPQKRNPDLLEVTRAKTSLALGFSTSLLALGANEMSGYHRDLQWSKYLIMDLLREVLGLAPLAAQMVAGLTVNREAMRAACAQGFLEAADVADMLARTRKQPFRAAYKIVADAVAGSEREGRLTPESLGAALKEHGWSPLTEDEARSAADPSVNLNARKNAGGPCPEQTRELASSLNDCCLDLMKEAALRAKTWNVCREKCAGTFEPI